MVPRFSYVQATSVEEATRQEEPPDESEPPMTSDPSSTVTMNGRSVMAGWMEHWGYDWEGPVEKGGYALEYKELNADLSGIAQSFRENVAGLPAGSVVFFKFCFADFFGDNLSELEGIVDEVIGIAKENGLRLILGNALPMGASDAPSGVVSEYEGYNGFVGWAGVSRVKSGRWFVVFNSGYWHASYPWTEEIRAQVAADEYLAKGMAHRRELGMPDIRAPRGGRIHIMHSDDRGKTWSKPETLVNTELTDLHPTLLELDDGALLCTFCSDALLVVLTAEG